MFDGIARRVVSIWFHRLASDRFLRQHPLSGPFALTIKHSNANRLYCLNTEAAQQGLHQGMPHSDARAFCPKLQTAPADLYRDQQFLLTLRRWATRYCPWVGLEGRDGLVLDISGSSHLFGGEDNMLSDIRRGLTRAGLSAQIGLADTRGAAWALAHFGEGQAAPGAMLPALKDLPVAALRLDEKTTTALIRLGLRKIGDLATTPRAPLTRRFGPNVVMRLDQALGQQVEEITPLAAPPHYGVRMTLPEPIGLIDDVMAGTKRLLTRLCATLKTHEMGARVFVVTLRRVDQGHQEVELRLARPLRDPLRILPLFEKGLSEIDAGFGIDQLRLEATQTEALPAQQMTHVATDSDDRLDDLITRLGTRIGLENIQRFLPADSHIPERSFITSPAAYSTAASGWVCRNPRPLCLFHPEPIAGGGSYPPTHFRWRRMSLTTGRATGPERITPEWWFDDDNWRSGLRDYWRVETTQGRRLWLFYTPQNPGWYVQGEFA
ncbi:MULTISPECIES: Y-family DNA polymerase [unclassified Phaeobacter]|uniref:Y-family DNA polymerase n=1 Tax=unclassified Phaeobacter TaxID=2621772 RepID=UPI003A83E2AB